jgi:hypothetical protein
MIFSKVYKGADFSALFLLLLLGKKCLDIFDIYAFIHQVMGVLVVEASSILFLLFLRELYNSK